MTDLVDQMIERAWAEKERAYYIAPKGQRIQKHKVLTAFTTALLKEEQRIREAA